MLISPGVSVTVTDDSFFIPAGGVTTPLIFMATASEKLQPNGDPALGTYEYDAVRTITSLEQSIRLFGIPLFKRDVDNQPQHGDARNEYGLMALNQYLGLGNRAFVVRANVNLNDDEDDILDLWYDKIQQNTAPLGAALILESLVNAYLNEYNTVNGLIPADSGYRTTVTATELETLTNEALQEVFGIFSDGVDVFFGESTFRNTRPSFVGDHTSLPKLVYASGFDQPSTGSFIGLEGARLEWVANNNGGVVSDEWSALEARNFLITQAELFQYTLDFTTGTSLGANDGARRASVVQALAASINSNTEVRSEKYEYNLILAPGYYEVVDELVALSRDIGDEAFIIADTPMDMDPETVVQWAGTADRQSSTNVAYYYPHGLASNIDGNDVLCAAAGIALRTYTYNDEVADLWWAPAGLRRGLVSGVSRIGHFTGLAGTATTFVETNVNQGQTDDLYKYFTNINPIVFKPGRGIMLFGQKTSAPAASALDRVNVARLIGYIKRQLRKNSMPFIFEPNDQLTRDSLKAAADGFLNDLVVKRGLYDFATICDESNNTPDRIDRNEMYLDIAIKPVKAAEFIYIPIRVVSTGAEI